jgi:glycosyltransferase involved in cell wall biosynthesis
MTFTVVNVGQNYHIRGGSDRYLFALEGLLESAGHRVIPFAAGHAANVASAWSGYFPPPVDFQRPRPRDLLRYLYSRPAGRSMRRLVREQRPDLAHLHIYYGQLTASILSPLQEAGIPVVQTLHEFKTVCPTYGLYADGKPCEACAGRHFWRAVHRRCNRGSLARSLLSATEAYLSRWLGAVDRIGQFIAVSDFVRDKVVALGLPADRVTTVHNFVDCTGIEPATHPGDYLLYFGRLERSKGVYTLLDAAAHLKGVKLLLVGDGSERAALADELVRRRLDHVHLLGFRQGAELQALIRDSICTVAPSECYETFGLTLVESFAHGRPVVCSRTGGMTEVVDPGVTGFVVPPGNAAALAERLQWMADHRDQARAMGLAGRRVTEQRFSPATHYERLMGVYHRAGVR